MCITYDAVACQVWLDPISEAPAGGQPLCADHAQRLSAPRGWVILDRRTSQSTLMTAGGPSPSPTVRPRASLPRRRLPRAWGQFDAPRLEFVAEETGVDEPVVEEPVVEEPVIEEPVAEIEPPVLEVPVVEEPVVEAPVVEEPVPEAPVVEQPPAPVATRAPARRRPRPAPEPAAGGRPKGRLLGRAFEAAGPQRSAITEALAAAEDADDV